MPGHAEHDLMLVLDRDEFTVDEVPGDLDAASRLALVRRLIREGLLTVQGYAPQ